MLVKRKTLCHICIPNNFGRKGLFEKVQAVEDGGSGERREATPSFIAMLARVETTNDVVVQVLELCMLADEAEENLRKHTTSADREMVSEAEDPFEIEVDEIQEEDNGGFGVDEDSGEDEEEDYNWDEMNELVLNDHPHVFPMNELDDDDFVEP
ncbi:unnamed protein product [Cochlearia groenlandica]